MGSDRLGRRTFLKHAAQLCGALTVPQLIPASVFGRAGTVAPSNRIVVGCIGVGGMGTGDMGMCMALPDVQVVAVCDPKRGMREAARQAVDARYGKGVCAAYNDFRELVAREDIDAVSIASNDHWHVLHALAGVRAGKDVYVEKPLGMSLEEIKSLRQAVHRYGRIFQFGTQQRSMPNFRMACELVLNGRIGKLHTIRVSAPSGYAERTGEGTFVAAPVPEGFDYEMWLGPAPGTPYTPKRVISPHWFHISDYSLGYIAGWGIHHVDIAQWGNGSDLSGPVEITGSGVFPSQDGLCDNALIWDVTMTYRNGVKLEYTSDGDRNKHGIRFEGSNGWVYVNRSEFDAQPKSLLDEKTGPDEVHLRASTNHQRNWIDCIKTRAQTVSNIDVAVRSDTLCHLSDIAVRLGRKLRWDPEHEEFVNDPEANRRLRRAMRSPWHL
jgi:predicted dehydrogenase